MKLENLRFYNFARTVKFENIYESYSDAIDFSSPKRKKKKMGKKLQYLILQIISN